MLTSAAQVVQKELEVAEIPHARATALLVVARLAEAGYMILPRSELANIIDAAILDAQQ